MKNAPHEGRFFLVPISTDYRELEGDDPLKCAATQSAESCLNSQ